MSRRTPPVAAGAGPSPRPLLLLLVLLNASICPPVYAARRKVSILPGWVRGLGTSNAGAVAGTDAAGTGGAEFAVLTSEALRGGGGAGSADEIDDDDDAAAVSEKVRPSKRRRRKPGSKSNAVGDPDGNSSDDESSEDDSDFDDTDFDIDDLSDSELEEMLEEAGRRMWEQAEEDRKEGEERKEKLEKGLEAAELVLGHGDAREDETDPVHVEVVAAAAADEEEVESEEADVKVDVEILASHDEEVAQVGHDVSEGIEAAGTSEETIDATLSTSTASSAAQVASTRGGGAEKQRKSQTSPRIKLPPGDGTDETPDEGEEGDGVGSAEPSDDAAPPADADDDGSGQSGDDDENAAAAAESFVDRAAARQSLRDEEDLAQAERERAFDDALVEAFLPLVSLPPPPAALEDMRSRARELDVAGRRRLDRRTLYEGLLVELTHSHSTAQGKGKAVSASSSSSTVAAGKASAVPKRRYLDPPNARSLRSALSLASQPKWRRHLVSLGSRSQSAEDESDQEGDDDISEDDYDLSSSPFLHASAVRLYSIDDDEDDMETAPQQLQPQQQSGGMPMSGMWGGGGPQDMSQGDDEEAQSENGGRDAREASPPATMGMQETVAAALAHSLGCGLALIDDVALSAVRRSLLAKCSVAGDDVDGGDGEAAASTRPDLRPDSADLRPANLLGHLARLANEGRFPSFGDGGGNAGGSATAASSSSRVSRRMERDMALGLDDPNDDLAVESLRLMRDDERIWFEDASAPSSPSTQDETPEDDEAEDEGAEEPKQARASGEESDGSKPKPLPLILFVRTDSSPSLLRSKSAVDRLARECVSADSIHLLCLGKGIDATTVSLPQGHSNGGGSGVGEAVPRMGQQPPFFGMGGPNPMSPQQQGDNNNVNQNGQSNPFAGMSPFPPGAQGQTQPPFPPGQQPGTYGFSQQNINASGINDPEGSKRINIFLGRTVDAEGNPGIVGAIAPPQAGNLFPQMLAMQARENMKRMQQQGQSEEQMEFMERMKEQMREMTGGDPQQEADGGMPPPQFFNASIGTNQPGGMGPNGQPNIPPEIIQQAIQQAMDHVIDRLADLPQTGMEDGQGNPLPPHLARAFSEMLKNPNLRRGIHENLSRAAPALVDPRCQGVMLSIYVPPGPDHPNRGMMPGQQGQGQQAPPQGGKKGRTKDGSKAASTSKAHQQQQQGGTSAGMSGWLNKILSSSSSSPSSSSKGAGGRAASAETEENDDEVFSESEGEDDDSEISGAEEEDEVEAEDEIIDLDGDEEESEEEAPPRPSSKKGKSKGKKKKRGKTRDKDISTIATAAAIGLAAAKEQAKANSDATPSKPAQLTPEQKSLRNLSRLESLCRPLPLAAPSDPVRSRSWDAWASRERGAVMFRRNRRALNAELARRRLRLRLDTGTRGMGCILRRMMSVRDVTEEMGDVVKCAVEIEASRSQRHGEMPWEEIDSEEDGGAAKGGGGEGKALSIDKSLQQLVLGDDDYGESLGGASAASKSQSNRAETGKLDIRYIHPHSIETALSLTCRIGPSPTGSSSTASGSAPGTAASASHRTREEISALAQNKHERALVSQVVSPGDIGVSYDMIGGLGDVKELLRQSITYPLKYPHLYSEGIANEAVKGVLLFGPPGTGKTMLAKAVATEGGATFLSVDASSVENKWLGESEKNAKAVFTLARRLAPCVIFIDEVDSILSSREGSSDDSAHGTLTSVKTTMMSEWDGLNSGTNGKGEAGSDRVVVIGSTNRPFDLDEAVLRRFPRRILVDLPDLGTRQEILEVTLSENRLDPAVNLTAIAERLEGYTGSDIKEVCREAVVRISHEQARLLDQGFFDEESDDEEPEAADSTGPEDSGSTTWGSSGGTAGMQRLRPAEMRDFESAMSKLKRSVSEKGRELARVWEWNEEYGEIKKKDKRDHLPQLMNMFL